jgi:hypothetical protein
MTSKAIVSIATATLSRRNRPCANSIFFCKSPAGRILPGFFYSRRHGIALIAAATLVLGLPLLLCGVRDFHAA